MVGDLKYGRTVHSLTQALAKFEGNRFYFIAPDALAMPQYILDMLNEKGIAWSLHGTIEEVMAEVDILYMTPRTKRASGPVRIRQRESTVCSACQRSERCQSEHEGAASAAAHR
ncbi:aspartate carbamoyltransferase catalytic subunit [Citrobacter braakii]|nr:aspartate carbamoyltransferase catalytic subunit [Citrobacter braakii]